MRLKSTITLFLILSFNLIIFKALPCTTFVILQKGELFFFWT